jgi:pimeloyl-ACP methyl ester carboxylesterase
MLVLPGIFGFDGQSEAFDSLAENYTVIVATHPGFDGTTRPSWCDSVNDLLYAYLDLIEREGMEDITLVGCSLGGWIALELAVLQPSWLSRLVLVDSVGLRVGDVDERDFADIFALTIEDVRALAFADPRLGERYLGTVDRPTGEVVAIARNQEATAAYGWKPYLHNPKLGRRLHRVRVPTFVVWGERDGIAEPRVGRGLTDAIPSARLERIAGAGHLPHIERPAEFTRAVRAFLQDTTSRPPD